jgi:hypothetical protein
MAVPLIACAALSRRLSHAAQQAEAGSASGMAVLA